MATDSVVIGIVLGLIFAAVSYYLFSRIGQLERKVGLMENILLDLKVTTEQTLMSMTEPPPSRFSNSSSSQEENKESELQDVSDSDSRNVVVETTKESRSSSSAGHQQVSVERESSQQKVSANYESMTYKELVQLAKNKNISGTRNLSKSQVIDLIRRHDSGDAMESSMVIDDVVNEGNSVVELLSAQQTTSSGTPLDSTDVDSSLVQ